MKATAGQELERLVEIMRRLRSPQGCPWDREQNLQSLRPFLIEEAYEVLDALDDGDRDELKLELGDLLFQIVFQAQLTEEEGTFALGDVIAAIADKLVYRHPHVFADLKLDSTEEVHRNWANLKRAERESKGGPPPSALEGIPRQAPALLRAERMGEKASREGFDWPDLAGVRAKVTEELRELDQAIAKEGPARIAEELGDVLFSLCNLARRLEAPAETALRGATERFESRFRAMEELARNRQQKLSTLSPAALDALWNEVKANRS